MQASREDLQEVRECSADAGTGGFAAVCSDPGPRDIDSSSAEAPPPSLHPFAEILPLRVWALAGILTAECLAFAQLPRPWIDMALMPAPIAFGIALLLFGRNGLLRFASSQTSPVNRKYVALHICAIGLMALANVALVRSWFVGAAAVRATIWLWTASLLAVVLSLVAALVPPRRWLLLVRSLRGAWAYAALATYAAIAARRLVWVTWDTPRSRLGGFLQHTTFLGVKAILSVFYAHVVTFPATSVVGTSKFGIRIEGGCTGIEGVLLMLVLSVIWLVFMRSELRMARAIWLVPIALAAVWLLNLVRLAVLISIGDAGHPNLAVHGFHTEAGWVFFNAIAIGFLLAAEHVAWLHKGPIASLESNRPNMFWRSAEVVYVLPFLAIVVASMVSQLFSSGFEWLYPLRFVAGLLALWSLRREYRRVDWRFGWLGPLAGAVVFVLWLWLSKLTAAGVETNTLAQQLAPLPLWQRTAWLAVRCSAMVVTVPVAEELAFRGYLARRVMDADVEAVRFENLSPMAILASAVPFGLLHGQMWIAGILAGVVFALVAKLRGRLGEAVAAHATVNLLLAIWGLATGNYSIW